MSETVLLSIQVGKPAEHGTEGAADPLDQPWTSGFFKSPLAGPVFLGRTNLDGDGQADFVNHGGEDKAVCCYPADHYDSWRRELGLAEMPFGAFGENFTIGGLTEADVCIGDVWRVGEATVQVSQPRQPCWKLVRRWRMKDLPGRVVATGRTGWYFRVLEEGNISPSLPMALIQRPFRSWTVERANWVMYYDEVDRAGAAELAKVSVLSTSWREALAGRAD